MLLISKYGRKELIAILDTKTAGYLFNSLNHSNIIEHRILMPKYVRNCHCHTNCHCYTIHRRFCYIPTQVPFKTILKIQYRKAPFTQNCNSVYCHNKTLCTDQQTQNLNLCNQRNDTISIDLLALIFKWQQLAFTYDILFVRNLNFNTFYKKP